MNRLLSALFMIAISWSCTNNTGSVSPYSAVLSQPPYHDLNDSIRKQPDRDELYFHRAILLNKNNEPGPALADFQKAWSLAKEEPYAIGVSNILLDIRPDSAVSFLISALAYLPQSILLQLTLARSYDAQHKPAEALATCNAILKTDPTQVNALLLKADLLQKKNDNTGAITALEQAHALLPENLDVSNKLAYQYAESKNPKAVSLSDSMIVHDSLKLHAEPYYVKGVYYSNIKDDGRAILSFNETIEHDHRFLNAYIEKGKIQLDQKKTADALKTFQLCNTISPAFPDAYYWIGKSLETLGQMDEAKSNYEKAYGLDKTFAEAKEAAEKIPD